MAIKTLLVCLAVTALLALTAGVVLAETVRTTNGRDLLESTPKAGAMRGLEGPGDLLGRGAGEPHGWRANDQTKGHDGGDDEPWGVFGRDLLAGSRGADTFYARSDGQMDEAWCGDDPDAVYAAPQASVAGDCETVELVGNP